MVERASVELGHLAVTTNISGLPGGALRPERAAAEAQGLDTSEYANAGSGTSRSANHTVSSAAARQAGTSRRWGLWLSLCVFGGAAAVALWYWQHGGFPFDMLVDMLAPTPSAASLPEPPGEARALSGKEPSERRSGSSAGGAGGSVPPVLQIDSLPEQTDLPDAGAEQPEPTPGSGLERAAEHAGPATHRGRRGGKRGTGKSGREEPAPLVVPAEKSAKSAAPPANPASTVAATPGNTSPDGRGQGRAENSRAENSRAGSSGTGGSNPGSGDVGAGNPPPNKADCEPPWYIDAKGIRKLKPVCL
jgi:hypothetical protein